VNDLIDQAYRPDGPRAGRIAVTVRCRVVEHTFAQFRRNILRMRYELAAITASAKGKELNP